MSIIARASSQNKARIALSELGRANKRAKMLGPSMWMGKTIQWVALRTR